jgi:MFS family permease
LELREGAQAIAPSARRLWLCLFVPLAAGYLLSYLYRSSNAVIGPLLANELGLSDQALGLLTSTYFLTFGAAQLPLGILLDRYGPRRVESLLLLCAAVGAVVFAQANDLFGLATGRALIGLGVSCCLMAAFKGFSQWFAPERQPALVGWVMAAGGLGALAAAQPLQAAVGGFGWRDVLLGIAALTLLVSALIWKLVPDKFVAAGGGFAEQVAGVRRVLTDRQFWRYAPMVTTCLGGFMAVQGLWVARWMTEIEGLTRPLIAQRLTWMSVALVLGCLFMGFLTTPLIRRGVSAARMLNIDAVLCVLVFAGVILVSRPQAAWLWVLLSFLFPLLNVSYAILTQSLPLAISGRANTALNLAAIGGAFGLQWGMGAAVDALRAGGASITGAYRATFVGLLFAQALSVAWMLVAGRRGIRR